MNAPLWMATGGLLCAITIVLCLWVRDKVERYKDLLHRFTTLEMQIEFRSLDIARLTVDISSLKRVVKELADGKEVQA